MKLKLKLWSWLLKMPSFIKTPLLRQIVSFPSEIDDSIRFKVAETKEELEQAFKLLHDAYVSENLMQPHPSGMRVTKYHALPSTTTLIALENNVVIGTVSLIRHSVFGMPLSTIFDLKNVPPNARLAEVSSLAIRKENLHRRGRVLFPLMKFLVHYSTEYFGVTHFAIAVNPKWIDFYKSILCFRPLSKRMIENYSFVNGAPALGAILNLTTFKMEYFKVYGHRKLKKNLYAFFSTLPNKNMEFPMRKKSVILDPIMTPEIFKHFFIDKTDVVSTMNDIERYILREMYSDSEFLKLIPASDVLPIHKKRSTKRFDTNLEGRLVLPEGRSIPVTIRTASQGGLGGFVSMTDVGLNTPQKILINIEELKSCELKGHFIRMNEVGEFGFVITEANPDWNQYIHLIEERMLEPAKAEHSKMEMPSDVKRTMSSK